VPGAIAIALFCSLVLLAMIITIIVHRDENDIRMLEFSHMTGTCALFTSCAFILRTLGTRVRRCTLQCTVDSQRRVGCSTRARGVLTIALSSNP
jgi:hypothetical protein